MMAKARANATQAKRMDLVAGFGTNMAALADQKAGASKEEVNRKVVSNALDTNSGGFIISQRGNALRNFTPVIRERLHDAHKEYQRAVIAGGAEPDAAQQADIDIAHRKFMQSLASTAGLHDAASQVSPENARELADQVLSNELFDGPSGGKISVQQMVDSYRSNKDFLEMRREYGSSAEAAARRGGGEGPPDVSAPISP